MATDRSSFNIESTESESIEKLITTSKPKKKVAISGENNFDSNSLANVNTHPKTSKKRGRPVQITDDRFKVKVPKKISPALESKLSVLQDYMVELQDNKGRVTFEKIVSALADSYISNRLSVSKEEHVKREIQEEFDKI
ncbi:hypothetical protein [Listeria booriae]|uniref:Uncharacterized protein n=1 Tax=Listeria booriae TaxID=1552123 RepID=A0A7X1A9F4_9LIST|nr:hypothetical protein [Listeria booriae]MBC1228753.1 hypothetical protein [Listeria booriae]MBC2373726.1 hypothetical protein [Listeria booriae]